MNKTNFMIGGIIFILLLAVAAFVAARLLNGKGPPLDSSGGPILSLGKGGGAVVGISADDIQPAKELPQVPADIDGIIIRRQDNSLFIGTGRVMMSVRRNVQSGEVETSSSHDGPALEVVVTSQAKVYRDVTMKQFNGPPPQGQKIQQVVEEGSLDEVGQASLVIVWGKKTGARFIAEILVYSLPEILNK